MTLSGARLSGGGGVGGFLGTPGSIPFAGASGLLTQNNAELFWDRTNKYIGIGSNAPAFKMAIHDTTTGNTNDVLEVRNMSASGYSTIWYTDSTGTDRFHVGFANSTVPITFLRGFAYFYTVNGTVFTFADITSRGIDISPLTGSVGMEFSTGGAWAVSSANRGRLRYNTSGQKFQVSYNGAAYVDLATGSGLTIGGTVVSATVGSVFFAGTGPVLAQDNANFFWDDTNDRLGIGTSTPGFALAVHDGTASNSNDVLEVRNKSASGYSTIWFTDSTGTDRAHIGFANSTAPITYLRGFAYFYTANGTVFSFSDVTARAIDISPVSGSVGMEFAAGASYAVSSASKGRLRYNSTTTQRFQVSANGAAYLDVPLLAAALSTGSVPFGASGNLTQDATFIWDNTNKSLRIGAAAVSGAAAGHALDVSRAVVGDVPAFFWNTSTSGYSGIGWNDPTPTYKGSMGYGNSAAGIVVARLKNFLASGGPDYVFIETITSTMLMTVFMTAGSAGIALAQGAGLAVSAANTCNLRWNNTTSKLQISKAGAAYIDII